MDDLQNEAGAVPLSGVILAGGRGSRLGVDKTAVEVGGEPIIRRTVRILRQLTDDLIVVLADLGKGLLGLDEEDARFVADRFPGYGSLGGIYTGVVAAVHHYSLVVACDMPFLNAGLLQYMRTRAATADVLIPRVGETLEPLHAIYSKNCLVPVTGMLAQRHLKIIDFFPAVRVAYLEAEEIDRYDPLRLSFFNINTPEDLARARALATQEKAGT